MTKNKKELIYVLLSVCISIVLAFTILPISIVNLELGLYWSHGTVHTIIMIMLPLLSLLGAISSRKLCSDKIDMEQVFLNIGFPIAIIGGLRVFEFNAYIAIGIVAVVFIFALIRSTKIENKDNSKMNILFDYTMFRRFLTYVLLIILIPISVFANVKDKEFTKKVVYVFKTEEISTESEIENELVLVSESEFSGLTVEEKCEELRKVCVYEQTKLGLPINSLALIKDNTDSTTVYYSHDDNLVYINSVYLDKEVSLKEAVSHVCRQIYMMYSFEIKDSLEYLMDDEEAEYEKLQYYEEAVKITNALNSYTIDQWENNYNYVVESAFEYAKKEIAILEAEGYFK